MIYSDNAFAGKASPGAKRASPHDVVYEMHLIISVRPPIYEQCMLEVGYE
jgi:hypothetical protein